MVTWWHSKAGRMCLRILSLSVSSIFLFTQVVGASIPDRTFWANRQKSKDKLLASREKPHQSSSWSSPALLQKGGINSAGLRVKKLEEKDVASEVSSLITPQNLFTVPSQYGTVKEVHSQASSDKGQRMENRLIIHIQDAHSSPLAQLNSANILKYLQKDVPTEAGLPLLICVEGSSGLVDTTLLSAFPEKKIKEEVASEFLKEGKITGEEYFAITKDEKPSVVTIYGVEDKRAYEKNLRAFDEGVSSGQEVRNYLKEVGKEIKPLKTRLYNKRLKELESKIEAYEKKRIPLTQYCQYLHRLSYGNVAAERSSAKGSKAEALPLQKKYPNFELFVQASKLEDQIDFSKVDTERSKYIKELSEKLTNEELSDLLIMSLDYRLGKITSSEYYTYLQSLSFRMGKGVRSEDPRILTELVTSKEGKEEYPNLNLYIKYNKLYDRIDQNKLFSEISDLEQVVKEGLCETEEEKKLVKLSRMLDVLQDLTNLRISNEDLAYYYKHRDEITEIGGLSHFFAEKGDCPLFTLTLSPRGRGRGRGEGEENGRCPYFLFEEFYRIALRRNEALVNNTISRMEKEGVKVAILIAGGFHTPGITELLREKNISYVVVTPRLEEDFSSEIELSPRKKRTDLEKAIAGIIGALRPASLFVGDSSFPIRIVIDLNSRALIFKKALAELKEKWQKGVDSRPELAEAINSVEFSPIFLTRGQEAFVLGVVRVKKKSLPFVFAYDTKEKKVSEIIFGEDNCREFLISGTFENGREVEVGQILCAEIARLWSFLSDDEVQRISAAFGIVAEQKKLSGQRGSYVGVIPGGVDWIVSKVRRQAAISKGMKPEDHEPIINTAIKKGMKERRFVSVERKKGQFKVTYGKRALRKTFDSQPLVEALGIAFDRYENNPAVLYWLENTAYKFITPEDGHLTRAAPLLWYEDANRYLIGHAGRGLKHAEQNSYLPYALIYQLINLLYETTDTEEANRMKSLIARIISHEALHAWEKRYGNPDWEDEAEVKEIIAGIEYYLGTPTEPQVEGPDEVGGRVEGITEDSIIDLRVDGKMQRFRIIKELQESVLLGEEIESKRKFVIRLLISEEDEQHAFWISEIAKRIPHQYPNIYHAQLIDAGKGKWAGKEEAFAIVYPYIEGDNFKEYLSRYVNQPVSSYFPRVLHFVIRISEIAHYLKEKGAPGVWDFNPSNIIITPAEKPVLIDYTFKNLPTIPQLEWLLYFPFESLVLDSPEKILDKVEFVSDKALNKIIVTKFREIRQKVKSNRYKSIKDFVEDLKPIDTLIRKYAQSMTLSEEGRPRLKAEVKSIINKSWIDAETDEKLLYEVEEDGLDEHCHQHLTSQAEEKEIENFGWTTVRLALEGVSNYRLVRDLVRLVKETGKKNIVLIMVYEPYAGLLPGIIEDKIRHKNTDFAQVVVAQLLEPTFISSQVTTGVLQAITASGAELAEEPWHLRIPGLIPTGEKVYLSSYEIRRPRDDWEKDRKKNLPYRLVGEEVDRLLRKLSEIQVPHNPIDIHLVTAQQLLKVKPDQYPRYPRYSFFDNYSPPPLQGKKGKESGAWRYQYTIPEAIDALPAAKEYVETAFRGGRAFPIYGHGSKDISELINEYEKRRHRPLSKKDKTELFTRLVNVGKFVDKVVSSIKDNRARRRMKKRTRFVFILDEEEIPALVSQGKIGSPEHCALVLYGGQHRYLGALKKPRSVYKSLSLVEGFMRRGKLGKEYFRIILEHEDRDLVRKGEHEEDVAPETTRKINEMIQEIFHEYNLTKQRKEISSESHKALIEGLKNEFAHIVKTNTGKDINRNKGYDYSMNLLRKYGVKLEELLASPAVQENWEMVWRALVFGKARIFRYWNRLSEERRRKLIDQLKEIRIELVENYIQRFIVKGERVPPIKAEKIETPKLIIDLGRLPRKEWEKLSISGEEAYREGIVGWFETAGGRGGRLGFPKAKSLLPVGQVRVKWDSETNKYEGETLAEMRAQANRAVREEFAKPVPWLIMTSYDTDNDMRNFFKENDYFGIPANEIRLVRQRHTPDLEEVVDEVTGEAWTAEYVLKDEYTVSLGGFGHGDANDYVLKDPETRSWLASFGTSILPFMQNDNVLAYSIQPIIVGIHKEMAPQLPISEGQEKVTVFTIGKTGPEEKLGVCVLVDGKHTTIEYVQFPEPYFPYTYLLDGQKVIFVEDNGNIRIVALTDYSDDMTINMRSKEELDSNKLYFFGKRKYTGKEIKNKAELWLNDASPNVFIWDLNTVGKQQELPLFFTPARKPIDGITRDGRKVTKEDGALRAFRFEKFVFHADSERLVVRGRREEGFAPIKERKEYGPDSRERAAQMYNELETSFLINARKGWQVSPNAFHSTVESKSYDLTEEVGIVRIDDKVYQVRQAGDRYSFYNPETGRTTYSTEPFAAGIADINLEGKQYRLVCNSKDGRLEVTNQAIIRLTPAFAFIDGRYVRSKIGNKGYVGYNSTLYIGGKNTGIGDNFHLSDGKTFVFHPEDEYSSSCRIGNNVSINANVRINLKGKGKLFIEDDATINEDTEITWEEEKPLRITKNGVISGTSRGNVTFGNIREWLHRGRGGLNDLIENLFDEGKDVSEEFTGEKSADAMKRRVGEFLIKLEYDDLTPGQKISLKIRKILTFGKEGIWDKKEFDNRKNDLIEELSIYYLDSGKGLFWVNPLRMFGPIFDLLPKGLQSFLSKLVSWRYAAAHYGVRLRRAYISAGYATRASPDQLFEVAIHEALHILGFSHRQALKIVRQHNISYGAQELMDKLAKEDAAIMSMSIDDDGFVWKVDSRGTAVGVNETLGLRKVIDKNGNIIELTSNDPHNPKNIKCVMLQNIKADDKIVLSSRPTEISKDLTFNTFSIYVNGIPLQCETAGLKVFLSNDNYIISDIDTGESPDKGIGITMASWVASHALSNDVRIIYGPYGPASESHTLFHIMKSITKRPEVEVSKNKWEELKKVDVYEQFGPLTVKLKKGGEVKVEVSAGVVKKCKESPSFVRKSIIIAEDGETTIDGTVVGRLTYFDKPVRLRGAPNPINIVKNPSGVITRYKWGTHLDRDKRGRFKKKPGKSPKDAKKVIVSSRYLQEVLRKQGWFSLEHYGLAYEREADNLGFEPLAKNWRSTARRDLEGLAQQGFLTIDESGKVQITPDGEREIAAIHWLIASAESIASAKVSVDIAVETETKDAIRTQLESHLQPGFDNFVNRINDIEMLKIALEILKAKCEIIREPMKTYFGESIEKILQRIQKLASESSQPSLRHRLWLRVMKQLYRKEGGFVRILPGEEPEGKEVETPSVPAGQTDKKATTPPSEDSDAPLAKEKIARIEAVTTVQLYERLKGLINNIKPVEPVTVKEMMASLSLITYNKPIYKELTSWKARNAVRLILEEMGLAKSPPWKLTRNAVEVNSPQQKPEDFEICLRTGQGISPEVLLHLHWHDFDGLILPAGIVADLISFSSLLDYGLFASVTANNVKLTYKDRETTLTIPPTLENLTEAFDKLLGPAQAESKSAPGSPGQKEQGNGHTFRSFIPVIFAVILGWASTGITKEIVRTIATEERILEELGKNGPAWSMLPILAFLGLGILVGGLVSYKLKRLEMRDTMMGRSGTEWFMLRVRSFLLVALVGGGILICIASSPFLEEVFQTFCLIACSLFGYVFGYILGSSIVGLQWEKREMQIKAKLSLDAIVEKFSVGELEHMVEQIEKPTFKGEIRKEKTPVLYDLLLRLKYILYGKDVRNRLPDRFQRKKQIGGLLMLKEALARRRLMEDITPSQAASGVLSINERTGRYIRKQIEEMDYEAYTLQDRNKVLSEMIENGQAYVNKFVAFIKIPGLLDNTGEFAHIGLGQTYGETVVYIDEGYAHNEIVEGHEDREIKLWENALKVELRGKVRSLAKVRRWMKENLKEAIALTKEFHDEANKEYNIDELAREKGVAPYKYGIEELLAERLYEEGKLPEVIFRKPATGRRKEELKVKKEALDKKFGRWTYNSAVNRAKEIKKEMVTMFSKVFDVKYFIGSDLEEKDDSMVVDILLDSSVAFREFKMKVKKDLEMLENGGLEDQPIEITPPIFGKFGRIAGKIKMIELDKDRDWLIKFESLREELYELTQWDLLNRFPGAEGMVLWRQTGEDKDRYFGMDRGAKIKFIDNFFTYFPSKYIKLEDYEKEAEYPVLVAYVPIESIERTSWLLEEIEPEVMVNGPAEFIDSMYIDKDEDVERLDNLRTEYERALFEIEGLISITDELSFYEEDETPSVAAKGEEDYGRYLEDSRAFTTPSGVPVPVRIELANHAFENGLTEEVAQRILNVVSRQDLTGAIERGRAFDIRLSEKDRLHHKDKTLKVIRLKPVTYKGQPPRMEPYSGVERFGTGVMLQPPFSFGVDSSRRISIEPAPPEPVGSGYLDEEINEYTVMGEAFQKDFPTAYPIGIGQFIGMVFEGEPVGFVIMALENVEDKRVGGSALFNRLDKISMRESLNLEEKRSRIGVEFSRFGRDLRMAAKLLRRLQEEIGITHTQPHVENFAKLRDDVRLYDFTGAKSIRNMTREEFILRVINDFRGFYGSAYASVCAMNLEAYLAFIKNFKIEVSPLEELVKNYFTDRDKELIGEVRLRKATDVVSFDRFITKVWIKDVVQGKTLEELKEYEKKTIGSDLIGIFEEIAGPIYDKLMKSPEDKEQASSSSSISRLWSLLFGGLAILLFMNQDLFAAVGKEIIRNGPQAGGWGGIFDFVFGLGLWGILACAVTVVGARVVYQKWGERLFSERSGLVDEERVRLSEVLGLQSIWQAVVSLFDRGWSVVAAALPRASKREEMGMRWVNFLVQPELSENEIKRIRALAEKLRRGEIARFWTKRGPFFTNPEINPWWTSPEQEIAEEVRGIVEFAESVREDYDYVVVMGRAVPYAKLAVGIAEGRRYPQVLALEATRPEALRKIESKINPEKTLFVVSSRALGEGYGAYRHFYRKLTQFYEARGVSTGEIASQVGRHFVGIGGVNSPFIKEARKFLRVFTEESAVSRSIFSYEGLVPLALAGVDIEKFLESGREAKAMCQEENFEKNPGMRLAKSLEKMVEGGREIFVVLPEGMEGFGEWWQELVESLWGEEVRTTPITEGELSSPESYGENVAFIAVRVGVAERSSAISRLREAGYPVFELPRKEAIGGLSYIAEYSTALSYLMGIDRFRRLGGAEELSLAEAVGPRLEVVSLAGAVGFEMREGERLYQIGRKVLSHKDKGTKVFVFDFDSLFDIESIKEATPYGMDIQFKVKPKSREVFRIMGEVVKVAEEVGNPYGVKFAPVSSRRNLSVEVMEEMLRDYMSGYGLGTDVISRVIDRDLIIDRKRLEANGGIVGIRESAISTRAVFNIINEQLLVSGRSDGNGTEIKIITDRESRWAKDGTRKMMERILWVLLEPAKEGEMLSTAAGLVVAIEGKVSDWLKKFIRSTYPEAEAERILSEIVRDGKIILPATPVDKKYLQGIESEARIYKVQA